MLKFLDKPWFKPARTDRLSQEGRETLDTKPMAIPVGFKTPETLAETVARLVRSAQWEQMMHASGNETFDEANDFDIEDEEPWSPHELVFDPVKGDEVPFDVFSSRSEAYREAHKKRSATTPHADKKSPSTDKKSTPQKVQPDEGSADVDQK